MCVYGITCSGWQQRQHFSETWCAFGLSFLPVMCFKNSPLTGIFGVFPTPFKDLETAKFRLPYRKRDLVYLVISMDKLAEQGS